MLKCGGEIRDAGEIWTPVLHVYNYFMDNNTDPANEPMFQSEENTPPWAHQKS